MKRLTLLILVLIEIIGSSCEDFVQVDLPNTKISSGTVFARDETAVAATLGMYDVMQRITAFGASGGQNSITALTGLSSDEFKNYSQAHQEIYTNNILTNNANVLTLWSSLYNTIYIANSVIEGVSHSTTLSESVQRQLLGEAKFIRSFCHFYLVNLFGDVPMNLTTDYRTNTNAMRIATDMIYTQIVADLTEARDLLVEAYPSPDRGRPNRYAAVALLSRVYLYKQNWAKAEEMATEVIGQSSYALATSLDQVFLMASPEAIWQLPSAAPSRNTWEGRSFILLFDPFFISLNEEILAAFENDDQRKIKWINTFTNSNNNTYYYSYKYKISGGTPKSEHSILLRLAEQYLIRAEARAQQEKLTGPNSSASDLNAIRSRAGLPPTAAITKEELLTAILNERRVELFTEWGHRWFDLKRTGKTQAVLSPSKPELSPEDELYPIPETEMAKAPNLKPQNPGY
jgi:starch-binding outer membrane protein, SusD/RagB family